MIATPWPTVPLDTATRPLGQKAGERNSLLGIDFSVPMKYPMLTVKLPHRDGNQMTLPDTGPTRKQRFEAALKLWGITTEEWRTSHYRVSAQHLNEVWKYDIDPETGRKPSAELDAAIDATISKYLGAAV